MGGGLGGGSSDAATVLLALNHLWQTGLDGRTRTTRPALGADVPVFVHGRNTFAEGIGEHFTDVDCRLQLSGAASAVNVPTAAIFGAPELPRDTPAMRASRLAARHGQQ
jgi:4-diphosphocytidyl-2-C-methyl-D-erythritol kinase